MAKHLPQHRGRIEQPGHGRFLTFSCFGRLPLFANDLIKDRFVDRLGHVRARLDFRLYAWVVMPEHVHLLMQTVADGPRVEEILTPLKGRFGREVIRRWRELDAPVIGRISDARGRLHFWQAGRGYDRNLFSEAEWQEKIAYIHQNPVKRGLARLPQDWRWSSARWYAGEREGALAMDPLI